MRAGCVGLALVLLAGCGRHSSARTVSRELENAAPRQPSTESHPLVAHRDPSGCITPGRIVLRGTLRREVHLGPPGYGENPATDERDTIVALVLPKPFALCRDSTVGSARATAVVDRRVTLWHVTRSALEGIGQTVTAYGTIYEAAFLHEFGPLVLQVDSVPDLQLPAPRQAS